MKSEPRIIIFDLETMPDLAQVMKVMPGLSAYPGLTLKASINSIICFGYKVWGETKTHCISAWDYPDAWSENVNNDYYLVKAAAEILLTADVIVTHNGRRFDLKFMQTRLVKHGLPPLPKIIHIDTCQEAKKHLMLFNNRLNTLATFMTDQKKLENGGWDLWDKVLNRDEKAMALMVKYCKQDVNVTAAVFKRLLPLITTLPNYNITRATEHHVCPKCGSTRLQSRGCGINKFYRYYKYQCSDCGGWSSARREDKEPKA